MTETNSCVEKGALIDYLYGEADAEARARVEAHLRTCVQCADEVSGLKDVRGNLEAWVPPQAELGFRLVSDAEPEPVTISVWSRLRRPPVWGLATAAAVVLAAAVAITKPELEMGGGRWCSGLAGATPGPTPPRSRRRRHKSIRRCVGLSCHSRSSRCAARRSPRADSRRM